jgi:hypothetical protein
MDRSFSRSVTVLRVDNTDPRDPVARCDRCGIQGTLARAIRHTDPPLVLRYCGQCWPPAQEELEQRQREEHVQWQKAERVWSELRGRDPQGAPPPPPAWSNASRSWYDTRRFLALITQQPIGGDPTTAAHLAAIATEIRAGAAGMDGPIPPDIEDFLAQHPPPAS